MALLQRGWDLLVVGGGTAGLVAARTAAGVGARVVLVERARTGGDCLWTGCVPSKALLSAARHAADARRGHELGVTAAEVTVDFATVMGHVHGAMATIQPQDSPESLEAAGVRVLHGDACFTGVGRLQVDGHELRYRRAVVATGSSPLVPPVPGLREARPLTSDTVWGLRSLPERLVVLGGGAIGCELGQAFARLGAHVTLLEAEPRILTAEDPDAAEAVHDALARDGVRVLTGHELVAVHGASDTGGTVTVRCSDGPRSADLELEYDGLLVAVGRVPATSGLGLDAVGVTVDGRGHIVVDDQLRTSGPGIWAAGDVTPVSRFTHTAGVHGTTAAINATLGLRRTVDSTAVPRVTYTDPEVAAVGDPTWTDDGAAPRTVTRSHHEVDRAVVEGRTDGFTRLALGTRSRVVGATVVGPRAGESLAELTLAVRTGLSTRDLAGTTHPYPTYGDGPWNAALDDVRARLSHPVLKAATTVVTRLRSVVRSP